MESTRLNTGRSGEEYAANYLETKGYAIIQLNWRYKNHHEIDVLAIAPDESVVAVEVRSHLKPQGYAPFESIDERKIKQIYDALRFYAKINDLEDQHLQVDVVSIVLETNMVEHFEAVDNTI